MSWLVALLIAAQSAPETNTVVTPLSPEATIAFRQMIAQQNAEAPAPSDPEIRAAMMTAERDFAVTRGRCSPTSIENVIVTPATAVAIVSNMIDEGHMRNGWRVSFESMGCETHGSVHYTLFQMSDGQLTWLRIGQGETRVNASIYIDTMNMARPALVGFFSYNGVECADENIRLPSMRLVNESEDMGEDVFGVRLSGEWSEEWTFYGCGHKALVPISYRWDGATGASISIALSDARFEPIEVE